MSAIMGDRLEMSLEEFIQRGEELVLKNRDTQDLLLLSFLCDAVRLAREYSGTLAADLEALKKL